MSYVTGVLYNVLRVLLAPFAAVFRGFHVPAAPEPPASLSPDLVCMVTTRMLWPDWLHGALQLQPPSYNFKLMIGKLEVDDWPLSPRGQGWQLYVSMSARAVCMGCKQLSKSRRLRGETFAELLVYDCQRP
jgi:hypothetical protein